MNITQVLIPTLSLGGIGLFLSVVLVIVAKKFKVEEDPLIDEINELLPQANCGGCGFPGCKNFAEALVRTKKADLFCPVGGNDAMRKIYSLLGMSVEEKEPVVARLMCNGTNARVRFLAEYHGIKDCTAMKIIDGGEKACPYSCYGLGTCVEVCMFDAMKIEDGIVKIDENKCTGCGACVKVCPQEVLTLVPKSKRIFVACSNHDIGAKVKKACDVACIACKRCEKACEYDAIHVIDNVAIIDYTKCTNCGECVKVCPTKSILNFDGQVVVLNDKTEKEAGNA